MVGDGDPWEVKKKKGLCSLAFSLVEDINQIIMLSSVKLQL